MHRRKFFNFLGAATLGTIIALKLPDTIAPKLVLERIGITFQALMEAYDSSTTTLGLRMLRRISPECIEVSPKAFEECKSLMAEHQRFGFPYLPPVEFPVPNKFLFMNAELRASNLVEDGQIQVFGKYYGNMGRYYYL